MIGAILLAVSIAGPPPPQCKLANTLVRTHARGALLRKWRLPKAADLTGRWLVYSHARQLCPYAATLRINGDQIDDLAVLLPGLENGYVIAALLSTPGGYTVQVLEQRERGTAEGRGVVYLGGTDQQFRVGYGDVREYFSWDEGDRRIRQVVIPPIDM